MVTVLERESLVILTISLVFVSLQVSVCFEGCLPFATLETTKSSTVSSTIVVTPTEEDGGHSFLRPAADYSAVTVNPIPAQAGSEEDKSSSPSQLDHEEANITSTMVDIFEKWHATEQHRLNSSETLTAMKRKEIQLTDVPYLFPKPTRTTTVEVYNQAAWERMLKILHAQDTITVCANGGSSTAGAKLRNATQRFFVQFVDLLQAWNVTTSGKKGKPEIKLVDRAHGSRHSFHSALLGLQWFFVPGTDILIWEFAINDQSEYMSLNHYSRLNEIRNTFFTWLEQVSRIQPKPPIVILAYIWSSPFRIDSKNRVFNLAFDAQIETAKEFDFVAGHINLASYLEELHFGPGSSRRFFLADGDHPAAFGHAAMSYLMLDFVLDNNRAMSAGRSARPANTSYSWECGNSTSDIRLMERLLVSSDNYASPMPTRTTLQKPLATLTGEIPRNDEAMMLPGMLMPSSTAERVRIGQAAQERVDRHIGFRLPCCEEPSSPLTMNVLPDDQTTLRAMKTFMLGLHGSIFDGDLRVFVNDHLIPTRSFSTHSWRCSWNFDIYDSTHWVMLDDDKKNNSTEPTPLLWLNGSTESVVSSISLCLENEKCKNETNQTTDRNPLIMGFVIY